MASRVTSWTVLKVSLLTSALLAIYLWATATKTSILPTADPRLRCLSGVVTVQPGGRLANRILEYASAWSLARLYGLRVAVPTDILRSVEGVYSDLSATALEDELARGRCAHENLTAALVMRRPTAIELSLVDDYVQWAREYQQPIVLRKWVVLLETIVQVLPQLQEEFTLREEFIRSSSKIIASVHEHMINEFANKKVIFIGIHVRRTDYQAYLHYKFGAKKFAEAAYFKKAVEHMRSYIATEEASAAFIVASDDPRWCLKTLIPALQEDLQIGLPPSKVFLVSARKKQHPGYDLAVLSSCNHSIIAYGTYGIWAALMAGGRTIVYDMGKTNNPEVTNKTVAMRFADLLHNWVAIP